MLFASPAAPPDIEAPEFKDSISGSMLMLKLNKASEKNGKITHYLIVVVTEEFAKLKNPEHFTLLEVRVRMRASRCARASFRDKRFFQAAGMLQN